VSTGTKRKATAARFNKTLRSPVAFVHREASELNGSFWDASDDRVDRDYDYFNKLDTVTIKFDQKLELFWIFYKILRRRLSRGIFLES